jgi:hypothetical protein
MAIQNYTATFMEAYEAPDYGAGFTGIIIYPDLFCGPKIVRTFNAANTQEVVAKVTELGDSFGKSLGCYVRPTNPRDRKPPGFDAATRNLTFNLTPEPKDVAVSCSGHFKAQGFCKNCGGFTESVPTTQRRLP